MHILLKTNFFSTKMGQHSDDEMENESDQDFSDDEDYVDDISDADLMPDLLKQKPKGIPFCQNMFLFLQSVLMFMKWHFYSC